VVCEGFGIDDCMGVVVVEVVAGPAVIVVSCQCNWKWMCTSCGRDHS